MEDSTTTVPTRTVPRRQRHVYTVRRRTIMTGRDEKERKEWQFETSRIRKRIARHSRHRGAPACAVYPRRRTAQVSTSGGAIIHQHPTNSAIAICVYLAPAAVGLCIRDLLRTRAYVFFSYFLCLPDCHCGHPACMFGPARSDLTEPIQVFLAQPDACEA